MIFKLASREIKNNYKYWGLFCLNLTIGLLGFTFIYLFRDSVARTLELRSKTLLSSDMAITGRRALSGAERKQSDKTLENKVASHTHLVELYSMGRVKSGSEVKTRLVHAKVIEGKYPLIGEILLKSGEKLTSRLIEKLQDEPWVVISKELAHQFKIAKGGFLKLGNQRFEVLGIVDSDSTTSMRGVSLAPKVYFGKAFLDKTGLISFGTVAWYTDYYNLKKGVDLSELEDSLKLVIKDGAIGVKTPKGSGDQLGRVLNYLSDYLGLIGLVALLISTVGASYLFQSYIYERLKQIGILKSLGVSRGILIKSFVLIIFSLGLFSSLLSMGIANMFIPLALELIEQWFLGDFHSSISWDVFFAVLGIGAIINILVCVPILIRVFRSKTLDLLQGISEIKSERVDYLLYAPGFLFLWFLCVWQAHSFIIGSLFTFFLIVVFGVVLFLLPIFLQKISTKLTGHTLSFPFSLPIGIGMRLLSRNKIPTVLTVLSLSIGMTLLSVIGQMDASIKSELTDTTSPKPSLFLFDIQEDQYRGIKKLAKKNNYPLLDPMPMIRARLIKINGKDKERLSKKEGFSSREDETRRRFNNRGVNLSYSEKLSPAEKMIEGREFTGPYKGEGPVEISLEKRYAQRMRVGIGDKLTYEILGVEMEGVIVNLRSVKWTSFLPNFFITIQPGALDDAPKTYISAVERVSFSKQLEIQDRIVEKFGNISILNVSEVIDKIMDMFRVMAFALTLMGLCCVFVGMFVLYSILQNQIHKKQKDLALQKLMGMSELSIFMAILFEYLFLAIGAMLIGNLGGLLISYLVSYAFLDGIFVFNGAFFLLFNTAFLALTVIIIFFSFKNNYAKRLPS